jgi:hypothetical protein
MVASNQVGEDFGPSRLVYNIRSTEGTNLGGKKYGVRIIGWTLRKENALVTSHNSSMCLAPMLLQLADVGVWTMKLRSSCLHFTSCQTLSKCGSRASSLT